MASATSIPRFLLPQTGAIWRRLPGGRPGPAGLVVLRFASTTTGTDKPIVLEKPERFNPPSHGSRLPKRTTPRHYGGDLNAAELNTQKTQEYPGLMSPKGTLTHWLWHSYWLHTAIAMGTLGGLAAFTFSQNFKQNSPFADLLPSWSDFASHPIDSMSQVAHVIRLSEARHAEEIQEKRTRKADDMAKRTMFRKAHGLPAEQGFWSNEPVPKAETAEPKAEAVAVVDAAAAQGGGRKKWLGIF